MVQGCGSVGSLYGLEQEYCTEKDGKVGEVRMTNTEKALELVQKCLDDWPYAATRVVDIMTRLEKVKELLKEQENASKRNPVIVCPHCGKRVK